MFNSNIPASSLLGIDGSGLCTTTPKTPEIVNSLIAMTNPLDNYNFLNASATPTTTTIPSGCGNGSSSNINSSTPLVSVRNFNGCAQDSSQQSSCTASPIDSPAGTNSTPTVQQTCSQLIKAGLKLSIQSKRKLSTCDSSSGSEQPSTKFSRRDEDCDETTDDDSETKSMPKGLTPEDEDRRRRRRERNKIAATKCRMKKRERTQNLIKESEQLDTQNIDLKNQVRALETERRKLLEMLQLHTPTCVRRGGCNLPSKLLQSPAIKYFAELELVDHHVAGTSIASDVTTSSSSSSSASSCGITPTNTSRTTIPPMSTIKFSRSNGFKAVAAATASAQLPITVMASSVQQSLASPQQQQQQQQQQQHQQQQQQQLPNGYCKPSPSAQELGYLNSPTQDAVICITDLHQQAHQTQCNGGTLVISNSNTSNNNNNNSDAVNSSNNNSNHHHHNNDNSDINPNSNVVNNGHQQHHHQNQNHLNQQHSLHNGHGHGLVNGNVGSNGSLTDYIPNCDSNSLSLALAHVAHSQSLTTPSSSITPTSCSNGGDNSLLLSSGGLPSPLDIVASPATASDFVKNELVDSQSPYTTAQSAERFLFENHCDTFVDIKHAVSLHPGIHNNLSLTTHSNSNNNNNNSNNMLDFHTSMLGTTITPFHDQISIKNDYLHDADLLAQLTDEAEFMDLDTGAATFITNGGCLA